MLILTVSCCSGVFQGTTLNTTSKTSRTAKMRAYDVVVFWEESTDLCSENPPHFTMKKKYYSTIILKQFCISGRTDPAPHQSSLCIQMED